MTILLNPFKPVEIIVCRVEIKVMMKQTLKICFFNGYRIANTIATAYFSVLR